MGLRKAVFFILAAYCCLSFLVLDHRSAGGASAGLAVHSIGLLALILYHPVLSAIEGKFDLFETVNIYSYAAFLGNAVPLLILLVGAHPGAMREYWDEERMGRGLALVNLSLLALHGGYLLPVPARLDRVRIPFGKVSERRAVIASYLLILLDLSCLAAYVWLSGGVDAVIATFLFERGALFRGYGFLQIGFTVNFWFILYAYAYFFAGRSWREVLCRRKTVLLACLLTLALSILSFSRGFILGGIVMIMIFRNYFIRRVSLRTLVLVFAVFLAIGTYIAAIRGGYDLDPFINQTPTESFLGNYLMSFCEFEAFLVVISTVPDRMPYFGSEVILEDVFYPLLPRVLWTGKKEVYGPMRLWEDIAGIYSSGSFYAVSLPGYFFMAYGVPGIVVGFFFFGYSLKVIYRIFLTNRGCRGSVMVYAVLLWVIRGAALGGAPTGIGIQLLLPIAITLTWVHGKRVPPEGEGPVRNLSGTPGSRADG